MKIYTGIYPCQEKLETEKTKNDLDLDFSSAISLEIGGRSAVYSFSFFSNSVWRLWWLRGREVRLLHCIGGRCEGEGAPARVDSIMWISLILQSIFLCGSCISQLHKKCGVRGRSDCYIALEGGVRERGAPEALADSDYLSLSRYLSFSVLYNRLLSDI